MKRLMAIGILFSGSACAITLGGGGDVRPLDLNQKFDLNVDAAMQSATYVATQAEGKLKGIKRIAITTVCVQFVNNKSAMGIAGGASRTYVRSASGGIPGGLDAQQMQAVADRFLDTLEADLTSAGYELVPYAELDANPMYQKLTAKYAQGIVEESRSLNSGKGGTADETFVTVSPRKRPFSRDCATISPAATSSFVRMSYPLNAELLTASVVVDMGQAKAGGGFLARSSADIAYAEFIRGGDSQYQFIGKTGPGARIWLKQSIVPQVNPFALGVTSQAAMTGSRNDLNGEVELKTGSTTQVAFDEALYYRNAEQHMAAMHRMFIHRMKAGK